MRLDATRRPPAAGVAAARTRLFALATLHRELLGIDPFSAEGVARQTEFVQELLQLLNQE